MRRLFLFFLTSEDVFSGLFLQDILGGNVKRSLSNTYIKKVPLLGPDIFLGERAFFDGATTVCEALGT